MKYIDEINVQYVKGVGEARARHLNEVGIFSIQDLLNYAPRRYLDRRAIQKINQLSRNEHATVVGRIVKKNTILRGRRRLVVTMYDGSGLLSGIWFNQVDYFSKLFNKDQVIAFSGKIGFYRGWQIIHPDFEIIEDSREQLFTGQIIPLYPGTQHLSKIGLTSRGFRRIIYNAIQKYSREIPENLPMKIIKRYRLSSRPDAYYKLHFPKNTQDMDDALRRFKYEELFFIELLMALRHFYNRSPVQGVKMETSFELIKKLLNRLPFELTRAQRRVLREIYDDMKSGSPMNRLLQGDVGSGKTLVALITALIASENGYQTAFMAPTEILAEQHFLNISDLLSGIPLKVRLLIGAIKSSDKEATYQELADGTTDLVIGTHALIQEAVEFKQLGLTIIDEQHRFGVLQRGGLIAKGWHPHVLVMTATPIPRTLAMTLYGDLDTSVIDELPPGRKPIITKWRYEESLPDIYKFAGEHVQKGEQVYIVYPLVEESEKMDLKAATESYEHLQKKVFPEFRLALLHGRMRSEEKEGTFRKFKDGIIQILVSTTVMEVGVDVPNATILIIEHSERFGLNQLHQLRGRVGRGPKRSYCILISPNNISETARERLKMMEKISDGFVISEEDLRLRGSGEFFGTRQHGLPDLHFSDLVLDSKIIQTARKDAFKLIEQDPHLRLPEHQVVRDYFQKHFAKKYRLVEIS